MPLHWT